MLHIGIDEAGYGPLLGPLVIAGAVFRTSRPRTSLADGRFQDSKAVYGRGGRDALGRVVTPFLGCGWPLRLSTLLERRSIRGDPRAGVAWYRDDVEDPVDGRGRVPRTFRGLYVNPLCEREFNAGCRAAGGNKASFLTKESLAVLARALAEHPDEDARVVCDKHGGRNRYAAHLMAALSPSTLVVLRESAAESSYRLVLGRREVVVRFRPGADAEDPPCGLASMTAKYVRELFMEALNRFFAGRVEGLRPTAGYYGDGRRFFRQVEPLLPALAAEPDHLLRIL